MGGLAFFVAPSLLLLLLLLFFHPAFFAMVPVCLQKSCIPSTGYHRVEEGLKEVPHIIMIIIIISLLLGDIPE
jgi:uncharacterized membrane protein